MTRLFALAAALALSCSPGDGKGEGDKGNDISNYKTIPIGTQFWMAENLDYNVNGSKCYNNDKTNCAKYGRLYDWRTAQKVCPSGWHLPDDDEWGALIKSVGDSAGTKLKAKSGWDSYHDGMESGNGTDNIGFSALPGSHYGSDEPPGRTGYWWSADSGRDASEQYRGAAMGWAMRSHTKNVDVWYYNKEDRLFSVRCVRD